MELSILSFSLFLSFSLNRFFLSPSFLFFFFFAFFLPSRWLYLSKYLRICVHYFTWTNLEIRRKLLIKFRRNFIGSFSMIGSSWCMFIEILSDESWRLPSRLIFTRRFLILCEEEEDFWVMSNFNFCFFFFETRCINDFNLILRIPLLSKDFK